MRELSIGQSSFGVFSIMSELGTNHRSEGIERIE